MSRSKSFNTYGRSPPFSQEPGFRLDPDSVRGPLPWLNPTAATFHVDQPTPDSSASSTKRPAVAVSPTAPGQAAASGTSKPAEISWRARDNRKGE